MKLIKILLSKWLIKSKIDYDFVKIFQKHNLGISRMISGSKSGYKRNHKENLVIFNGNIITKKYGKIWWGDLDVTLDFNNLKNIADEIKQDLYILREMDARFENENAGFEYWKEKAVTVIKTK